MAVRTITTRLAIDGEREYKKQLAEVNSNLRNLKGELQLTDEQFKGQANSVEALTAKNKLLRDEIAQQRVKVESLERAVEDAAAAYGEADSRTDKYRQSLTRAKTDLLRLNNELDDNSRYLEEAKTLGTGAARSIDEFGREAKGAADDVNDAGNSLSNMLGAFDKFKGVITGGAVVAGLKSVAGAVTQVVEASEEYRKVMGTLETSSQQAGYTAEQTAAVYDRLYSVLGDTQSAATTVANLQAIGLNQIDLMRITNEAIGAWATYGDSIPIDGLAESINETIRASQVTGTFADVLNWGTQENETFGIAMKENTKANEEWNKQVEACSSAEDYFNLALANCSTESERANLVMQAMSKQGLKDASDAWFDLNGDIVDVNKAQSNYDKTLSELGEVLSPAASQLKNFAADALGSLINAINAAITAMDWLEDKMKKAGTWETSVNAGDILWGPQKADGYHAGGLDRVPYDGYIASTHKDEAILTSEEARIWRTLRSTMTQQSRPGVTAEEYRSGLAQAVTALSSVQGVTDTVPAQITLVTKDGRELARGFLPDLRTAMRESPEVTDDAH